MNHGKINPNDPPPPPINQCYRTKGCTPHYNMHTVLLELNYVEELTQEFPMW